jgi:hypothetical protein
MQYPICGKKRFKQGNATRNRERKRKRTEKKAIYQEEETRSTQSTVEIRKAGSLTTAGLTSPSTNPFRGTRCPLDPDRVRSTI